MKKKASGVYRARLNARGFEQVPGAHFDPTQIAAPVVNEATIFMVLILIVMGRMYAELMDVRGAFLHGRFKPDERLYMRVPQGFEKWYGANVILLLLRTIYGLRQSAFYYWLILIQALYAIGLKRSKADPCLYYRWSKDGRLNLWTSRVDDLLSCGDVADVKQGKEKLKGHFEIDEVGELSEYVGCKIDYNKAEGWMRLTQPVLVQSLSDEFEIPKGKAPSIPAVAGSTLMSGGPLLSSEEQSNYHSGVGKLIHLQKFSQAEMCTSV